MVNYKKTTYKQLSGEYPGTLVDIIAEENKYFKASEDNSTEEVLTIKFELEDPTTMEMIEYTEKFVKPLTGGKGLFQKLLDLREFLPDEDGGQFDEQDLVGLKLYVTLGERKDKNGNVWPIITEVRTRESGKKKVVEPVEDEVKGKKEVDLPF